MRKHSTFCFISHFQSMIVHVQAELLSGFRQPAEVSKNGYANTEKGVRISVNTFVHTPKNAYAHA